MTAAELREARQALGLSQDRMAANLGVAVRTYKYWESGNKIPASVELAIETLSRRREMKIYDLQGQRIKASLPKPIWTDREKHGRVEFGTGITLEAIYFGPQSGRMFIQTYSSWDNGRGECTGTRVLECDRDQFLRACDAAGIQPPDGMPSERIE